MKLFERITKREHECIDSDAESAATWFCSASLLRFGQWTVLLAAMVSAASLSAADWPCYSADAARTSASTQRLAFPLTSAWTYHAVQPPAPAWPEPGREQHRLDFDYAFQPVVADGRVFFGSSADDTVRALGLADGQVQWQFTAGGPIRFAPAYADGSLYVASDDGYLYRLDADTGTVRWQFRAAPSDRKMLGNDRMISRWPCRSGALVADGVVYVTAGMWPSEGIFVYAIDAETGKPIWKNETSGALYRNQPHMGSSAFTGVCPQGYLLVSKDLLLVPSGRTTPAAFDRQTGKLVYYQPYLYQLPYDPEGWGNRGNGGGWALIAGELLLSPMQRGGAPDVDIELGQSGPRAGDGLVAYSLAKGLRVLDLPNRHRAVVADGRLYAAGNRLLEALDSTGSRGGIPKGTLWTAAVPDERPYSMAAVTDAVLIGGETSIQAFRTRDGAALWSAAADGQVRGIAVADGRVVIATQRGTLECFAPAETGAGPEISDFDIRPRVPPPPTPPHNVADSSVSVGADSNAATLRGGGAVISTFGFRISMRRPISNYAPRTALHRPTQAAWPIDRFRPIRDHWPVPPSVNWRTRSLSDLVSNGAMPWWWGNRTVSWPSRWRSRPICAC
jgi:outer membrane protein assembly factor BamB